GIVVATALNVRTGPEVDYTPVTIARPTGLSEVPVVEVVDGDTIKVKIGGRVYRVRYIGIDTPELAEWMGPEAKVKNAELVVGKIVGLEKDISETDRYGRLLRYVWAGEIMVNAELVRLGYAQVSTFPPDVKYQDWFLRLEREARNAGRGLWGMQPAAQPAADCSPCYPDVCILPPPPDLDCGDIPHRRFAVVGCDPHRFDGDHDGIGCER
ncbi:MAG: thermonuclease family protein, partial [Anaerolineae bacterium]